LNTKSLFKKVLTGLTVPQEYVCLASPISETRFLLIEKDTVQRFDITSRHTFLGYKPLIFSLHGEDNDPVTEIIESKHEIHLELIYDEITGPIHLADLTLEKLQTRSIGTNRIFFFKGKSAKHNFLSRWHQKLNSARNTFSSKKSGNVSLEGNLHDQVRVAYGIPRKISLITITDGERMNMFPTDLHGEIGSYYVGSLRIGGLATQQVEKIRTIAISEINAMQFSEVYQLGVNHMRPMKTKDAFHLAPQRTVKHGLPLPADVLSYQELELLESIDIGIHRLHFYRVVSRQELSSGTCLTHIHQYYAQWRIDHHLNTPILIRP